MAMGAACSSGASPATITTPPGTSVGSTVPAGPPTPTVGVPGSPAASPAPTGPCANRYFAVIPGAVRVYAVRTGAAAVRTRTRIAAVGGGGFTTLSRSTQGGERAVWTCGPDGLTQVRTYPLTASGGPAPGPAFHAFRSVGVTVPRNLYVGAAWTQTVTSHGTVSHGGVDHPETRVVQTLYQVLGARRLTTPGGTFRALRVQVTATRRTTGPSIGLGGTVVTRSVEWLGRDVGVVESVARGSGPAVAMRLLDYRVPRGVP